jgi:hypothetical protein
MQLTSIGKLFLAVIALNSVAQMCVANDDSTLRTLVEVRRNGDDGLTNRLGDALEEAFRRSPDFTLSFKENQDTLIVTIPKNVDWKLVGERTKLLSKVEFSSSENDQILGISTVTCWDDMLTKCANKAVKDAKGAARKIRPPKSRDSR